MRTKNQKTRWTTSSARRRNNGKARRDALSRKYDVLETGSVEVRICCPFCLRRKGRADDKYHLYVNISKGAFLCHRCGAKGDIDKLIDDDATAPILSKDWYTEVITSLDATTEIASQRPVIPLPDDAVPIESSSPAFRYLRKRGFGKSEVMEYRLVEQPDRYRIILPSYRDDLIDFWVSRTYINEEPKYLNPKGASRRNALFGFDQSKGAQKVIICEGVFSAMAARQATQLPSVATYGKLVASEQIRLLLALAPEEYIIAFDSDAEAEALTLAEILAAKAQSWVRVVDWNQLPKKPFDRDPDSVRRPMFRTLMEDAPTFDWYFKLQRNLA